MVVDMPETLNIHMKLKTKARLRFIAADQGLHLKDYVRLCLRDHAGLSSYKPIYREADIYGDYANFFRSYGWRVIAPLNKRELPPYILEQMECDRQGRGDIDLIAWKDGLLSICELKKKYQKNVIQQAEARRKYKIADFIYIGWVCFDESPVGNAICKHDWLGILLYSEVKKQILLQQKPRKLFPNSQRREAIIKAIKGRECPIKPNNIRD